MKKLVILFSLFISQLNFGQTEKNVGEFNKVTSFDKIEVVLKPGNEGKVVVEGTNSEDVEIVNKNGELKIRMSITKLLSGEDVLATVYYKKIDAVEANEGSKLTCESTIKATIFNVIAKEGSFINIKVNADKVNVKGSSGADITIDGEASTQDVLIDSGAILDSSKLHTKQTTITVNAGGVADVFAKDLVDAKVRAGGKITVFGKPKQINKKTIAGGKIIEN